MDNINNGIHVLTIAYTPTEYNITETATVTLTASNGATASFEIIGHSLPEHFAIVVEKDGKHFALPANMPSAGTYEGYEVKVEDNTVAVVPSTYIYSLSAVHSSRYDEYGSAVRFVGNDDKCLWASVSKSSPTSIRNYAELDNAKSNQYEWNIHTNNGKTYTNGNRLLGSFNGCDGMKTGYTKKSKYSLVATAHRGDAHLMSVVLGAENKDVRANVAAQMLNKGFGMMGVSPETIAVSAPVRTYSAPNDTTPSASTFNAAYNAATAAAVPEYRAAKPTTPVAKKSVGGTGVQFGAFSSRSAAEAQVANVKSRLNANAVVETAPNGMYRVRVNGLTDGAAQKLKSSATANGIESYVFH